MRKLTRTGVVAVTAVAVTSVGIAFAAWTANGTGSGSAGSTTAEAVGVSAGVVDATSEFLYPGNTVTLVADLVNNNPYPVSVVISEDVDGVKSTTSACDTAGHDVEAAIAATPHLIEAGETLVGAVVGTLHMGNESDDLCQGEDFTVDLKTVATSAAS